jgi:MFS family permease
VVNAYAVTFGGLLLLGGRAGDLLGRRRVFVFGLLLFSAASLLGGFATSQWWLLTARAVQGVGGAVIAPTALALIITNFPEGGERNRAFGVYAAMAGAGSAVGLPIPTRSLRSGDDISPSRSRSCPEPRNRWADWRDIRIRRRTR